MIAFWWHSRAFSFKYCDMTSDEQVVQWLLCTASITLSVTVYRRKSSSTVSWTQTSNAESLTLETQLNPVSFSVKLEIFIRELANWPPKSNCFQKNSIGTDLKRSNYSSTIRINYHNCKTFREALLASTQLKFQPEINQETFIRTGF